MATGEAKIVSMKQNDKANVNVSTSEDKKQEKKPQHPSKHVKTPNDHRKYSK